MRRQFHILYLLPSFLMQIKGSNHILAINPFENFKPEIVEIVDFRLERVEMKCNQIA